MKWERDQLYFGRGVIGRVRGYVVFVDIVAAIFPTPVWREVLAFDLGDVIRLLHVPVGFE